MNRVRRYGPAVVFLVVTVGFLALIAWQSGGGWWWLVGALATAVFFGFLQQVFVRLFRQPPRPPAA